MGMRKIFLLAKYLASEDDAPKITMGHLKSAVEGVEFVDEKAKTVIISALGLEVHSVKPLFKGDEIALAEKEGRKGFDEEVKAFKAHVEKEGFGLQDTVSKIYIEKKSSLKNMTEQINRVEEALKQKVFGQDMAVEMICDKLVETSYRTDHNAPNGIFFFLGPPATGKTMLAQLLVEHLDEYTHFKQFDMTQYTSSNEGFGLFGLTKGYSDAGEGRLTSFVKKHPKSVLVFDEIEKAHSGVHSNFLSVLANGKAVDGYTEEEIDFSQTIVIFTSNVGSELYNNQRFLTQMTDDPNAAQSTIIEALSREVKLQEGREVKAIAPELLSRLAQGEIVLFNKLPMSAYTMMAKATFAEIQESFEQAFGLPIRHDDFTQTVVLQILSFAPMIDARRIKAKLHLNILDKITDHLRQSETLFESVRIGLSQEAKEYLDEKIFALNEDEQNRLLHDLFRKNETVQHDFEIVENGTELTLVFKNVRQKKLPKSVDFNGDGALVFEVPAIGFDDIAGHHVAKARLTEVVEILKNPNKLATFGTSIPKGMLLYGPPGTGKTMLAKAFAKEAELPFISTTGTEILSIELMKKLFKRAREYAPSIIFIDEIDAIGRRENGGGRELIINQLLSEINGFDDEPDASVFIIAATNFKENIDDAVIRSGRIDLHVKIDQLDRDARAFFIDRMLKKPTQGSFDKEKLVMYTAGMTGADLEKVSRESSLYVIRSGLEAISEEILVEQINTIKYGERITHKSIEETLKETAYHEAGHAVVSRLLMPEIRIEQITVVPRNNALGFVSYDSESSFGGMSRDQIKNRMCVAMAGRVAQMQQFGDEGMDEGAFGDLQQATKLAYYAVAILGMDEELGYLNLEGLKGIGQGMFTGKIESRVQAWLEEARQRTLELVTEHQEIIGSLAQKLLEKEIVYEEELKQLLG